MFDFDQIIDRRHTDCIKYDRLRDEYGRDDLLPMWIADMDFQSPPAVVEAIRKYADLGIFGYTYRSTEGIDAFRNWVKRRYGWHTEREWISSSPGIVTALSLAVRAFTQLGDKILIMTPVYPPFYSVVQENGRELVCSPLKKEKNRYVIDWDDLEKGLKSGVRMLILCNSHNPVGRVWTKEELTRLGMLCCQYEVLILSDEIHADLALFGNQHTVMSSISEVIANRTLTVMAPSKTFNIAGMMNSVVVASNPELMHQYKRELMSLHLDTGNILGHVTLKAAYQHGEEWLNALIGYLESNIKYCLNYFQQELPDVQLHCPEGSFLLWIDFNGTGLSHEECGDRLLKRGKIALNDGLSFGKEGCGFRRMNIGCPQLVLQDALERIKTALK